MAVSKEDAGILVEQLQRAHRLSVAYYRRMLPMLDDIARQLDCQFHSWSPAYFAPPCKKTVNPNDRWAWDFVPLVVPEFCYAKANGNRTEVIVSLIPSLDEAVDIDFRSKNGIIGQPDPVTLPPGRGQFFAAVYYPEGTAKDNFPQCYRDAKWPEAGQGIQEVGESMKAISFEWALADVLHAPDLVVKALAQHVSFNPVS